MKSYQIKTLSSAFALITLLSPKSAEAHLVVKDSALFSGLAQPFIHGISLLFLISGALWLGVSLKHQADIRKPFLVLHIVFFIVGALLGSSIMATYDIGFALLYITFTMGMLIVLNQIGQARIIPCVFTLHGTMLGVYCLQDIVLTPATLVFFTTGSTISTVTTIYLLHCLIHHLKHPAAPIVIRVLGSWIVAITAMIFTSGLIEASRFGP